MVKKEKIIIPLILAIIFCFGVNFAFADMTSTNYQIQWDDISSGGGSASSATYQLESELGGSQAGSDASSASYSVAQGFRSGIYRQVVDFAPYIQNRSSQVAAVSATSGPFDSVTVTTTSGFSTGDYVLVVQNEGANQVAAMAKVTSVSVSPASLGISSDYAGSVPTIDGANDYVYLMDSSASISLGTLSDSTVITQVVGWVATSDVDDGYSVYMFSDGELRSGVDTIPGVSDGTVSPGSSEYGGRSSDSSLATSTYDTEDTAFAITPSLVASEVSHPFSSPGFVILKIGISSSQIGGSYTQALTAIFVGEY